jgi:rhamnose utilization protein RhaD (predicted bifunctional aldolase and dehydrogenase)/NAD(P)-dependent dehydrogenase (short-subunit alcohol dehydrogenase family)
LNTQSIPEGRSTVNGLLHDLVALARRFGTDPEFARGGGGNISVKVDGILYIKPSGTSLAALTPESVIALDIGTLMKLLDGPPVRPVVRGTDEVMQVALGARVGVPDGRRPSVECLFHALIPERFVLHTHPTTVNAVTCATRGAEIAERLFGQSVLWVRYTDPGLPLARVIRDARRGHEERTGKAAPRAMLLQNHGLIVAGESIAEIEETSARLVAAIQAHLAEAAAISWGDVERLADDEARAALRAVGPALRALLTTGDRLKVVTFDDSPLAVSTAGSAVGRELALVGPLTPDQIVYVGSFPLLLQAPKGATPDRLVDELTRAIAVRAATETEAPAVVLVPGLGMFAAGDSYAQADTVRQVYLDAAGVSVEAHRLGGVRPLSEAERVFIDRWEAEAYRRGVAAGAPVAGRARGLVVVVTGAAQGFGRAIAADLVAQGGHVVLADINAEQATREAQLLATQFGPGRAVGVELDVTDDESVAACFDEVVRRYGGLDLLVSNAGILRAGSVTTQPVAEFDAVTRVNYRGYFLCVRHAAPILARQHRSRPQYWGDVVEVNSKSGLAGSSRNSAYAGSKFGGIGLTESFALELVGDGIKVNAICPGNFLDGPLWSDPDNGLFVQYLREGKVPGAKTVEDVRRFYEAKVPMGRGCTPADVLEALYYVVAQRYETGQAIPVTGGQVMLK